MRNTLLQSVPSHLYNYGNNDVQMPNWEDAQMNMNRKFGYCMGSKAFESDNHNRAGDFSLPLHSSLDTYQPGYHLSSAFRHDDISQQPLFLDEKISVPQLEVDFQAMQSARKRPIEFNDPLPKNVLGGLVGDHITALNECNKNKRIKMTNYQQQWQNQSQETSMETQNNRKLQPVRRSQKLSDKITALQKLVSPYGKTDTASVLQEASIYIMLLQEQIQNLFRMLGSSYTKAAGRHTETQESERRQELDLRSKGLCLVPISITQRVTMEEGVNHLATSRQIVIANNF